jgi:hypothetical protein
LYHNWIRGFRDEIASRTGTKINIPAEHIKKDEIAVSGVKDKVELACAEIMRIYKNRADVSCFFKPLRLSYRNHVRQAPKILFLFQCNLKSIEGTWNYDFL